MSQPLCVVHSSHSSQPTPKLILWQLMECGAHGAVGQPVVQLVDTVPGKGIAIAIVRSLLITALLVQVLDIRKEDATPTILAQVCL